MKTMTCTLILMTQDDVTSYDVGHHEGQTSLAAIYYTVGQVKTEDFQQSLLDKIMMLFFGF